MGDESNLLLQTILNEQREARRELSEIMKTMVYKQDLRDTEDAINLKVDGLSSKFETHATTLATVKSAEEKNTHFRNSVVKGAVWIVGSVFVAVLGAISAIFTHPNAQAASAYTPSPTPAVTSSPFKQ